MKLSILYAFLLSWTLLNCTNSETENNIIEPGWPEVTNISKPWTRWWWMGSSVDEANLGQALKEYQEAGLGGLEITPIYGVKGKENQFIQFTSEEWVDMLSHTLAEAEKHDLGIDMALASGWPFGGPWVNPENACKYLEIKKYNLPAGEVLSDKIEFIQKPMVRAVGHKAKIEQLSDPVSSNDSLQYFAFDQVRFPRSLPLEALIAYSDDGEIIKLTDKVAENGILEWPAHEKDLVLIAVFTAWHGKMVERAGPGGEGDVIDHFSKEATVKYLSHFDSCFEGKELSSLRGFFNDSYEVDDAYGESNWTPSFLQEFENRRGYDLKEYLPALIGLTSEEEQRRVICDYRETLSDLLLDNFTKPWQEWAKNKGKIIRNQSHGSPANILDLYAASDIPETEGTDILNIKFASSAAHVTGKKLVSAEAATWLNEHFLANLSATKENVDRYLAGGINHIVYHGTTYAPKEEGWPGRMFYAAVHYAPSNPLWHDFPTLNAYVARTQAFLQRGTADNDVLLYFPVYDQWMNPERMGLHHFHGAAHESQAYHIARKLHESGYSFDFISDRQISNLRLQDGSIITEGKATYKTILVPKTEFIPLETFKNLISLANKGANIIFLSKLPGSVPGLGGFTEQNSKLNALKDQLKMISGSDGYQEYNPGSGKLLVGEDHNELLAQVDVSPEKLVAHGLSYYRFADLQTKAYFIANWSGKQVNEWIKFNAGAREVLRYDAMSGTFGKLKTQVSDQGEIAVLLDLKKGESCILQFWNSPVEVASYPYWKAIHSPIELKNNWNLEFVEGGPKIPAKVSGMEIETWDELSKDASAFSGQAVYSIEFPGPNPDCDAYLLSLGNVYESASIKLNGKDLGTLIGPDYSMVISKDVMANINKLEITVSNLMANRISYMDKNNIAYRNFYNINFAARLKENLGPDRKFTAVHWQPLKSGIEGPVVIQPLKTN